MDETSASAPAQDVSSGYETMTEVQEIEDNDSNVFVLDRNKIQPVTEGSEELQALGITVYDQDTFEKGLLDQVDEALEKQNRKKKASATKADNGKHQSKEDNKPSKDTEATTSSDSSQTVKLETGKQVEETEKRKNDEKDASCSSSSSILFNALTKRQPEETDYQRKVRLGEMTPFGSVVDKKDKPSTSREDAGLRSLNEYFNKQIALQKIHKKKIKAPPKQPAEKNKDSTKATKQTDKGKNKKSPLKKSILLPPKKKKKEQLGTRTSTRERDLRSTASKPRSEVTPMDDSDDEVKDSNGDDSDYNPEDDIREKKLKKKPAKKKSHGKRKRASPKYCAPPEEWGTDDSDWESSDEEKRAKRRRSSSKKEVDDGNIEDYKERLRLWRMTKGRENDCQGDHHISEGFKVPKSIWSKLYKFQKVGVQWLWELHQQGCGGVLGDEMGLGKTVQMIAFLAGLAHSNLRSRQTTFRGLGPTLIVCPTTVLHQWVRELHTWWPPFRVAILHESGSFSGSRERLVQQIVNKGGILVVSFSGVAQHCTHLISNDWHYLILDEGHKIRNPDAQVTLASKQFRTPHRIVLSGSPMQNNLKELWSLFDFVFPGKLGTLPVFMAQFAVPITQGGYANASEVQVATAFRCATVLRDTISPYLLRRMKSDVKAHLQLPAKNEQVLFCRLTREQVNLYRSYLASGEVERILAGHTQVFLGLIALRKICNHPDLYSGGPKLLRGEDENRLAEEERYGHWQKSGKMIVVESLLRIWKKQAHKVLLFTQSRQMLCILEAFVQKQGYTYLKLDGGTSISSRQPLINKFNQDPSLFVFLLTTRVGGLGVNLTGADRVLIYDPDWNPATDTQARERAWRIGQQNQVTVYRLITAGTIEEKVYHRQIFKQFLTNKVLNDPKQRRFFKSNDLFELFTLKETDEGGTETAAIFAGTGSEVKVKLKEKKKVRAKLTEEMLSPEAVKNPIAFSQSKRDSMMDLARRLSKVIGATKGAASGACASRPPEATVTSLEAQAPRTVEEVVKDVVEDLVNQVARIQDITKSRACSKPPVKKGHDRSKAPKTPKPGTSSGQLKIPMPESYLKSKSVKVSPSQSDKKDRKKHKHRSKRPAPCMFEGKEVSHLVAMETAKETATDNSEARNQDDYVLQKLFKSSGLQTVLKHDKIMEGGDADYALVEGEARRVAKEALQELKRSRQHCFKAQVGVPSWTGSSGAFRKNKRPGLKSKIKPGSCANGTTATGTGATSTTATDTAATSTAATSTDATSTDATSTGTTITDASTNQNQPMSSSDLLARMRQRRALAPPAERPGAAGEQPEEEAAAVPGPSEAPVPPEPPVPPMIMPNASTQDNVELLRDIRNFVAFGAVADGRASTQEIVDRFRDRLPPSSTPVFKCLLEEVCEFFRMPSGEGMWKLRAEFQW